MVSLAIASIVASGAEADPPSTRFAEHLSGFIYPEPPGEAQLRAVSLRLDCVAGSEEAPYPFCRGTYRCHRAAPLGPGRRPPRCRGRRAEIEFGTSPIAISPDRTIGLSGVSELEFDTQFPEGIACRFDGVTQPPWFSWHIPAIQGRYECVDDAGATVESGWFSVEARSFKPLHGVLRNR
jgi:hypothetical protein